MVGWIRNIVIIFAVLSAVYALLVVTANMRQTQKLRLEYKQDNKTESQEDFIEDGLRKYNRSLRPKLILGVYLIPFAIAIVLIWLAQYG
ncbi:hypothetical protein DES40_2430 [Litorimonas taeanensis]|uniref:Uncharacterized protein n=1 Tax=Litorimonas taeanensis TaxID=568099 RepID=A0A420WF71_9PROT|nr:hypothetical protein [Litorimonas taeanensis]RKQ69627.1 hypothetical protein DES40_2430 [Litorimonas taeanensis]